MAMHRTWGSQRTWIKQTATLGHVILHQFVYSSFSTNKRRHNETALVCITLRNCQLPENCLLFDESAQTRDANPLNGLSLLFNERAETRDVNPPGWNGQSLLFDERVETRDANPPNGLSMLFDESAQTRDVNPPNVQHLQQCCLKN